MPYQIKISPAAQEEIEMAVDYCNLQHRNGATYFWEDIVVAYTQLANNPWRPPRYKNVRSFRLEKFPFALYFVIHEKDKEVIILSCFQDFRNPRRK